MTFKRTYARIVVVAAISVLVACSSSSSTPSGNGGGSGVVYECCLGTSFYGCPTVPEASNCVNSQDAGTCTRDPSGDHECTH
jgi:hypothetical protein